MRLAEKKYKEQLKDSKYHAGDKIGNYELVSAIGKGGFGSVWKCKHIETGVLLAMKILQVERFTPISLQRFKDEVYIMRVCSEERPELFMPIIDTNITPQTEYEENPKEAYFYVMPLASKTGYSIIENQNLTERVLAIRNLFEVIEYLHSRGIVHRDIKLDNILLYNGRYVLSDYGLVSYPGKKNVTRTRELVGPRSALDNTSYGRIRASKQPFTDTCEFAKVIWMILTGKKHSFDGKYNSAGEEALYKNILSFGIYSTKTLDVLLEECTQYRRENRPKISAMRERFEKWWKDNNDSSIYLQLVEEDLSYHLFPSHQPTYAEWAHKEDIAYVLLMLTQHYPALLSRKDEMNRSEKIRYYRDKGYFEIILPHKKYRVKDGKFLDA